MTSELSWVVTANMGLGHQRAVYPLKEHANEQVLLFGEDYVIPGKEKGLWHLLQTSYEFLSRVRSVPLAGPYLFSILEKLQNITPYYPFRDQSQPSFQVNFLSRLIRKGMGNELCRHLANCRLPVITSFYAVAIAVEEFTDLPVYCIICDADINRVWVSKDPKKSRIKYLVPCGRAMKRLIQYGVPDERIYLTGFPLPQENIGGPSMPILREDLMNRLARLDPSRRFHIIHGEECIHYLGKIKPEAQDQTPLTITYAVGGAGAQTEIAAHAVKSLAPLIVQGKIRLNLVAGVRKEVRRYFMKVLEKNELANAEGVKIIYGHTKETYFKKFNDILHTTDLLWTKPSELSFYCGLGLPIIIAPCIGPHEVANSQWLQEIGAGFPQQDPRYCREWIMDYVNEGRFAQAAWDGFLYARKLGTYKIQEILASGTMSREVSPVKR